MTPRDFIYALNEISVSVCEEAKYDNDHWKIFFQRINDAIAEKSDFVKEATVDWTKEEWIQAYECQIGDGDPAVYAVVAQNIENLAGKEFFRNIIRENTEVIKNDVYTSPDKDVLYKSDALHGAVKGLIAISSDAAKEEALEAFKVCDIANEHLLYDLGIYLVLHYTEKVPELILDEEVNGDKLIILLSMNIDSGEPSEAIFKAMKQRFKNLPDNDSAKDVFAAVFGDYGDPGAIIVLRKFAKSLITEYQQNNDRELFSRIMMVVSVIEGLGGITDDLMP